MERELTSCFALSCTCLSPFLVVSSPSKDTLGGISDDWTRMVLTWKRQHKVGPLPAISDELTKPSSSWRARDRDDDHVEELKKSFQIQGSVNRNIEAAFVSEKVFREFNSYVMNGGNPSEFVASVGELIKKDPAAPLPGVFTGDHTVTAIGMLAKQYPANPLWTQINVEIYIAQPSIETERLLTILGNQSNRQNKIFLKQDYPEIVTQMHRQVKNINNKKMSPSLTQTAIRNYKIDAARSLDLPVASVGQIYQLAKLPDPLWVPLERILRGEQQPYHGLKTKKSKKAYANKRILSSHKFVPWSPLPVNLKLKLLQKVDSGEWTVDQFYQECLMVRARVRIRDHIMNYFSNTGVELKEAPEVFKTSDAPIESYSHKWVQALVTYPEIEPKVVRAWAAHVSELKNKDDLPKDILNTVVRIMTASDRQKVCRLSVLPLFVLWFDLF